jgi:uncharacterized small protein (DUF1192 family)
LGEYRGYEGRLKEYENRILLLSQEVDRLQVIIKGKTEDIESLN